LRYFWADTYCIDKSNSVELAEAINSMFLWYRNAAKCYIFLTDVSTRGNNQGDKDLQFRKSRWFTRSWTLQELIAPLSVEFFSREGEHLGDKELLKQLLHDITGIPIQALQGTLLSRNEIVVGVKIRQCLNYLLIG
jgi:hypothetical protein